MKLSRIVSVFALTLPMALSASSFANQGKAKDSDENERCSYTEIRSHTVKIIVSEDKDVAPTAEPEELDACFQDQIDFVEANGNQMFIRFRGISPFHQNLNGTEGKARAMVNVNPEKARSFKYAIHVVGYPVRDPWIRVRPR